jgi:hypothetical protein
MAADVLILSEVDVRCVRSGGVDLVHELATALHLNCFWSCEMQLLDSGGASGSAILTRFDLNLAYCECFPLPSQGVDFFRDGPQCNWMNGLHLNPHVCGCDCSCDVLICAFFCVLPYR